MSVMVAVMAPSLIALAALLLDAGLWMTEQTRLQIAADAAASAFSKSSSGSNTVESPPISGVSVVANPYASHALGH